MSPHERWAEIDALLVAALDLPREERPAFLRERCPDPELRATVERLLEAAESGGDSLSPGAPLEGNLARRLSEVLDGGAQAADANPDEVRGYRLLRRIGAGGMGEVWEAEQIEPVQRRVAIKLIRPGLDSRQVTSRFEIERQSLARMNHPNVAQVFDAGTSVTGRPYFAMEFVDGWPVTEHCDRARLPLRERLRLFLDVCEGVLHAHHKGIVHRDLKPSNILVALVGGRPVPKIIDFGIARAVEGDGSEGTLLTEHGQVIGTPEYMSPEQAGLRPGDVDTRADVYALGVILYELLAGKRPFERRDSGPVALADFLREVRETDPAQPSRRVAQAGGAASDIAAARATDPPALVRSLTGDLDWIAMRALEKQRALRYDSPGELAADLRRHLRDEPVLAGPPSATYRLRKFARRNRGLLAAAAAVVLALVAGLAGTLTGLVRARNEAERARTQAAIAVAVNEFLNDDLLAAVAPEEMGKEVTMRQVLDAAAGKVAGRFAGQPVVEASILETIGTTYLKLGEFDDAIRHLRQSTALRREALGPDHPDALESANALAETLYMAREGEEALALFEDTLERRRRVLGPTHRDTITSIANMGLSYGDQGRFEEAGRYFAEALELARRELGPEDPITIDTLHNFGHIAQAAGRFEEAEKLTREAYEISRRTLGPEHPDTVTSLANLGQAIRSQGRLADAEPYYREALETRRRLLGPDHPATLSSLNNMANLMAAMGRLAEAERDYRESLERLRRILGPSNENSVLIEGNLGDLLIQAGKGREGMTMLSEAVELGRANDCRAIVLGRVERLYGAALTRSGRYDEAEIMLSSGYRRLEAAVGPENEGTRGAARDLAALYEAWNRPQDAAEWRKKSEPSG